MNVLPAIERELRSQARQGLNHTLRVLGPAALLLVGLVVASDTGFVPNQGGKFFGLLNGTLFLFIWLAVPMITADCISGERREGTIGLLFLTPLRARDIVMAKGLVHGLRAVVLWLAALPMLTLPFLQGGLGWREAVLSAMINFSSICLALAAGLLASCFCKRWLRAQLLAFGLAAAFVVALVCLTGFAVAAALNWHPGLAMPGISDGRGVLSEVGIPFVTGAHGEWGQIFSTMARRGFPRLWIGIASAMVALSVLTLLVVTEIAAWQLRRVWQEEPPSARQQWLAAKLATPIVGTAFLRRWLRRKLERNPVGWLEMRCWSGRTVMWGWFGTMVIFYSVGLAGDYSFGMFHHLQELMALLLLLGVAASAAGSFQRERETGVMELLLVSPMTEWQIIAGRVRGLWGQFLPAMALLLSVWIYFSVWEPQVGGEMMNYLCLGYLTIPVIGLYHSLRRRAFVSAFLLTLGTGLLFPSALAWILGYLSQGIDYDPARNNSSLRADQSIVGGLVHWLAAPDNVGWIQLAMAVLVCRRLYRDLQRRNFTFSRSAT